MNRRLNITFFILGITMLLTSCQQTTFQTRQELLKYINDPKNGYVKSREYNDLMIRVKYLPAALLVSNEIKNSANSNLSSSEINKLYSLYENSRTFVMTISDVGENAEDIMYKGIYTEEEYRERFNAMNFDMKEYAALNTSDNKYIPALVNLENVYSLSKSRNINIVFSKSEDNDDLFESDKLDFVFHDVFFNSGISHFQFKKSDVDRKLNLNLN